jgi:hypothetical protein
MDLRMRRALRPIAARRAAATDRALERSAGSGDGVGEVKVAPFVEDDGTLRVSAPAL